MMLSDSDNYTQLPRDNLVTSHQARAQHNYAHSGLSAISFLHSVSGDVCYYISHSTVNFVTCHQEHRQRSKETFAQLETGRYEVW